MVAEAAEAEEAVVAVEVQVAIKAIALPVTPRRHTPCWMYRLILGPPPKPQMWIHT